MSGLGVAAINANVQKNASDNNRDVMLGDQQQNAKIVEAVAGLGTSAVANSGMSVGGNYYDMEGEANIDNSVTETTSHTTSTEVFANTTIDYQGQAMTLAELISQLQSAGATYSIDLDGDGTPDVSSDEITVDASTEDRLQSLAVRLRLADRLVNRRLARCLSQIRCGKAALLLARRWLPMST